jgi:hypothetical protein
MKMKLLAPLVDLLLDGLCALLVPADNGTTTRFSPFDRQTQIISQDLDVEGDHD